MIDTQLAQLSLLLVYGAMAAYVVALLAFATDLFADHAAREAAGKRPTRAGGIAMSTTYLGAVLHGLGIVLRGLAAVRVPWANMYEFTLVFAFVAVVAFLVVHRRWRLRVLGTLVTGLTLLMLGIAVAVLYVRADGLAPILDSYWLVIHVSVATLAIGVFALSAAIAAVQLIQDSAERRADELEDDEPEDGGEPLAGSEDGPRGGRLGAPATATAATNGGTPAHAESPRGSSVATIEAPEDGPETVGEEGADAAADAREREPGTRLGPLTRAWIRLRSSLPDSAQLERLVFRLNGLGFVLWTFTLIAGAIWAEHAWGRPWGWDAKEAWTFGIWVVYAAYLHARTTRGWQGRRSAYLTLFGFSLVLGNYFIVNLLLNSRHAYSGIG